MSRALTILVVLLFSCKGGEGIDIGFVSIKEKEVSTENTDNSGETNSAINSQLSRNNVFQLGCVDAAVAAQCSEGYFESNATQLVVPIPDNVNKSSHGIDEPVLIKAGEEKTVGSMGLVYVEDGGKAIGGSIATIFLKKGATYDTGDTAEDEIINGKKSRHNTIYFEKGANVIRAGDAKLIEYETIKFAENCFLEVTLRTANVLPVSTSTHLESNRCHLVQSNVHAGVTGGFNVLLAESGARLSVTGGSSFVFLKSTSTLENLQRSTVFYEEGASFPKDKGIHFKVYKLNFQ